MAEVGGGMEEDAGRGGDPSIGRRRHVLREVKNKPIRNHTLLKVWLCEVSPSRVGDLHFLGLGGIADDEARARSAR